jgi:hypothetical protein
VPSGNKTIHLIIISKQAHALSTSTGTPRAPQWVEERSEVLATRIVYSEHTDRQETSKFSAMTKMFWKRLTEDFGNTVTDADVTRLFLKTSIVSELSGGAEVHWVTKEFLDQNKSLLDTLCLNPACGLNADGVIGLRGTDYATFEEDFRSARAQRTVLGAVFRLDSKDDSH